MASVQLDPPATRADPLTGLLSAEAARERLAAWGEQGRQWQAMLIGLQRFQTVNRAFGQLAGDFALVEIARRVRTGWTRALDGEWFAARIDGSAFLLANDSACSRERWTFLAGELAESVSRPLSLHGEVVRLATRIALYRAQDGDRPQHALESLSHALAEAQGQSGRRIVWADGSRTPRGISAAALEEDLLRAIERSEIQVLFQPQFRLRDDRLIGAEALARWNHPRLGVLGASTLFAVAERADHIAALGSHIAARALASASEWRPELDLRLSLNLTAAELGSQSVAATICAALGETAFPPSRLTLEVTEQALLGDLNGAAAVLRDLAKLGIRVALDDFGSGFANFRYLKVLPLNYLKLDHTLTDEVLQSERDRAILQAIVAMARALDLEVIAEGVESEAQRAMLEAEGCSYFQGFLRAGALAPRGFARFAESYSTK